MFAPLALSMPFDRSRGNAAVPHDAELSGATGGIGLIYSSNGLALAVPARLTAASKVATPTPSRAYAGEGGDIKCRSCLVIEEADTLAERVEREGNGWCSLCITWTSFFTAKQVHSEARLGQ
jgi:hypothetical protein